MNCDVPAQAPFGCQAKVAPIHAQSDSGSIRVKLASGSDYAVVAQSDDGRISIPEMNIHGNTRQHHVDGKIGAGGPLIDVSTDSSNISIN